MRVLIGCEFSGVVRDAFIARGHDAMSCDLLPSDRPGPHYQGDLMAVIGNGWDLVISHPPCTWLCQAMRTNAARKDRPQISARYLGERDAAFSFVMDIYNKGPRHVAIENPIGYLNQAWRKPNQIIRPYMFGHPYSKDVCLWTRALPPLMETCRVLPPYLKLDFWSSARNPGGRSLKSITFQGIADAMAQQWGDYVAKECVQ